ncbi:MAG: class I SAM-dependent methyltransferase [Lachnospiraceae bacterium]|nr:class I SAM-dependent methyltransferase [Lachnospiraceae bacterium]
MICKKVTGTDISEEMIEICEELYPEDDFTFYVAKAEETHIPKLKYDIVTAAGVINWVDKDMFLQNMSDVMAADGKLVIYDFGITNQMRENPEYTDWYNNEYLNKFPKPKRNENIWSEKDMNETLTPIFMNSMRELVFKGYYWIIEKK